jgi:glycine hydroxymethyltransferase
MDYARQTMSNARAFAKALADRGFTVAGESFGHTETHQVWITVGTAEEALAAFSLLDQAGIRCNPIEIPGAQGAHGLRLGVQALTRRGFTEPHFDEVARLIERVLLTKSNPTRVRSEIALLLTEFPLFPLPFSFDSVMNGEAATAFLREVIK